MNIHIQQRKFCLGTQRGVALIVVLILLLVMTLLGLASLRSSLLEDRMTSGQYDRSLGFQAAEGALREAEARLKAGGFVFPAVGCTAGLCAKPIPVAGYKDRWVDSAFTGWNTATISVGPLVGSTPVYFIELMGPAPKWFGCAQKLPPIAGCLVPHYRITASSASNNRAAVLLQSIYRP